LNLFTTYYHGTKINLKIDEKELYDANKLLENEELKTFFTNSEDTVFVTTRQVNYQKYVNKFFEEIYHSINLDECFFGYFETFSARTKRIKYFKIPVLGKILIFLDFIFNRVFPKLLITRNLYNFLNPKIDRQLSKAEVLGRLVYNGFDIEQVENHLGYCFFKVKKSKRLPSTEKINYGLIFKMQRIGKNGTKFNIYKIRTMHPYSQFLQDYMLKKLGFAENGKIEQDFRIAPWGKVFRKYWLDELPQLWNVIKGDMKLIGVRPVSQSYFNMLPGKIKVMRNQFKPACIPPYIAFNKKQNLRNVILSEHVYMKMKKKNPYSTDIKLFFLAIYNIVIRGKSSA
jgi:hypothetical protein